MTSSTERFWSKVQRGESSECWPWQAGRTGGRSASNYGSFRIGSLKDGTRRQVYAHRMAYCLEHGLDPITLSSKIIIRHRCDFGLCCNPEHLIDGTQADNVADAMERGLTRRGEQIPQHKLTEEQVREIKHRLRGSEFHREIAADYGVKRTTITRISNGTLWAWVK